MIPTVKTSLFSEFAAADEVAWRTAAEESLEGAPFEKKLVTRTPEGIDLQPIYTATSVPPPAWQGRAPGFAPFVRGSAPVVARAQPWLICQEPAGSTPGEANRSLLDALNRGQNAVFVRLDAGTRRGLAPTGGGGLALASLAEARALFAHVDLRAVPVMIPAGLAALPVAALVGSLVRAETGSTEALHGAILADPLAEWVGLGSLPGGFDAACGQMAMLVQWSARHAPRLRTIGVDAAIWTDAGAHAVQELAFGLATGVEYLRRLAAAGVAVEAAAAATMFTWSAGSHFFLEIAKLRASRLLWHRVVGAAGGGEAAGRTAAHVRLTGWNKTLLDPHNNLLRATTEAFAAVVGGCQSLEIVPFDAVAGEPSELARRLARNLHVILAEECQLGRVVDPAGGSHYVEAVTRQLAEKAWTLFQEIEQRGGMAAAIAAGYPQALVGQTASERLTAVESRRDGVIGTNLHPNLREALPLPARRAARPPAVGPRAAPLPELDHLTPARGADPAGLVADLEKALAAGATVAEVCARLGGSAEAPAVERLVPRRRAEPFERLRRRAEAHRAATGTRPKVFLATMGPRKQHAARAEFAQGFFAAGGFEVMSNQGFDSPETAAAAALASGAPVAVICSSDDTYPVLVPPLAGALKAAGAAAPVIVLAGLPAAPELQQQFRTAGVDEFIHLRANCARLLGDIQNRLGLPNL